MTGHHARPGHRPRRSTYPVIAAATAILVLAVGDAGPAVFEPALGTAKRRIGARVGSSATAAEGTQNLLCAYLATVRPGHPPR
jgi:hypothetical protein